MLTDEQVDRAETIAQLIQGELDAIPYEYNKWLFLYEIKERSGRCWLCGRPLGPVVTARAGMTTSRDGLTRFVGCCTCNTLRNVRARTRLVVLVVPKDVSVFQRHCQEVVAITISLWPIRHMSAARSSLCYFNAVSY